ncbi:PaaI family thioesterase [Pseudomonas sp. CFBP 8771]|uniref:PaaI family thioesterase n=1 Tax=Pseudomonas sp. CFBP 8771 TaxID=2775285 RepID=UPI00177C7710|nr:PaaI family thioesterase [Pseudomonas sp. CFBP 8771]MBD8604163.1 PaaI family thioesterase [Pseudomonas sp. CFBP 8771]
MQVDDELTQSAYFRNLGCEVRRLDAGVAEVALPLAAHLRNRGQVMHGGAIFSLVDIAMGLACSTAHGFDNRSVTLECKINYLRAVSEGEVICKAQVLHAGRRTMVVEAEVLQGEKLMAKAQGTFMVL